MTLYELVRKSFTYNDKTGELTRVWHPSPRHKFCVGKIVGTDSGNGYLTITFFGVQYSVHNLVWLYVTGALPTVIIDHIDRNGKNNAWSNLREATYSQNQQNYPGRSPISGKKGVYSSGNITKPWRSAIQIEGTNHDLGVFATVDEAAKAREDFAKPLIGDFFNG